MSALSFFVVCETLRSFFEQLRAASVAAAKQSKAAVEAARSIKSDQVSHCFEKSNVVLSLKKQTSRPTF